jgi:hypothetical protein
MSLGACHLGSARVRAAGDCSAREVDRRFADLLEALGELARGAAGRVGLGRLGVVDDLPVGGGSGEQHRGGESEAACGDNTDIGGARRLS